MDEEKDKQNKKQDNQAGDEKTEETAGEKLAECQKQAEEYLNGWKRARADFENYKKDEAKRAEEFSNFANTSLILELISLVDEADIATKQLPGEIKANYPEWLKGIMEIREKFAKFLEENGVIRIKTVGEKFDPLLHESVGEEKSNKEEEGKVIEEVRAGYTLYGKVIRPARVKISKEIKKQEQVAGNGKQ